MEKSSPTYENTRMHVWVKTNENKYYEKTMLVTSTYKISHDVSVLKKSHEKISSYFPPFYLLKCYLKTTFYAQNFLLLK